ncbi:hypothetical protein F511_14201 [Dorcoceras hygrometricum]|uniref:Uncharacterized protein n=1 Tax=Dorcoceras hygrometricum TaxID=472368 RepID=A0A2Z7D181_9LAMI|nr:hypothetical protein F511_14201 [Dorcoceras hygrometricum]
MLVLFINNNRFSKVQAQYSMNICNTNKLMQHHTIRHMQIRTAQQQKIRISSHNTRLSRLSSDPAHNTQQSHEASRSAYAPRSQAAISPDRSTGLVHATAASAHGLNMAQHNTVSISQLLSSFQAEFYKLNILHPPRCNRNSINSKKLALLRSAQATEPAHTHAGLD